MPQLTPAAECCSNAAAAAAAVGLQSAALDAAVEPHTYGASTALQKAVELAE